MYTLWVLGNTDKECFKFHLNTENKESKGEIIEINTILKIINEKISLLKFMTDLLFY